VVYLALPGVILGTGGKRADFEPNDTVPMPAGSFIRRVARTPHYNGVKKDGKEAALIAICGMGPITYHAVDPSRPDLRVL